MSSTKRKAVTDERPSKKARPSTSTSEEKKPSRVERSEKKEKKKSKDGDKRNTAVNSVLQQEERAFPRGGGSVLAPIEHKQIRAEAERDALFEAQGDDLGDDADDGAAGDLFDAGEGKSKKKHKQRRDGQDKSEKKEGSGVRIQGLSYKNLVVGSVVLGQVTAITGKDVALALPNNLTGFVPITAVSEKINARIEKVLAAEDDEDEKMEDDDDEEEDIDLKKLFHNGQWLRAVVTATGSDDGNAKSKRHIELSVDPRNVNAGLAAESVVINSTLQASIRSVEDHGLIMDVGLENANTKGFVSKKDLGAAYNIDEVREGQVLMCLVTGKGSGGKVIKLSPDPAKFSASAGKMDGKNAPVLSEAPTVDAFLPGTAVDVLVTDSGSGGVVGKIMGMVDVTADVIHSGASAVKDMEQKYKIGSKVKGRLLWTLPLDDGKRIVGISLLDHILSLPPPSAKLPEAASAKLRTHAKELEQMLPLSSIVQDVKVTHVLSDRGLFLALPSLDSKASTRQCFAHISQISDSRIDSLSSGSGAYKIDSTHAARIVSFNPLDNLYYISLKKSVLDQAFLRIEDLTVGELVQGNVERLIVGGKTGITGVLVKLSDSITGLVPEVHFADAKLSHPDRKFREGFQVKGRVLSVDFERRHVRLTFKKSLVESDESVWKRYEDLKPGMESKGTVINLLPSGAVVQFYGNVRAWLPVAEMSEAFIEKPEHHFQLGQTVQVRILSVNPEAQEMKVSCKGGDEHDEEKQQAWDSVQGGQLLVGTVTQKSSDSVMLDLENGLNGMIKLEHLADGSTSRTEKALKHLRVGQKLADLLVLTKQERSRHVLLTHKPAMVDDAKKGILVKSFADVKEGSRVHGFVRNITPEGIYVEFVAGTVGMVPKSQVSPDMVGQAAFGLRKDQSVSAWVLGVNSMQQRFTLSMREQKEPATVLQTPSTTSPAGPETSDLLVNPVDALLNLVTDLVPGKVTKARIASVRGTQINVRLADDVQGRIDVSEAFDTWEQIKSKKAPLQQFKQNEVLDVKVLGIHDAKSHRFLPISHRGSRVPVFELSTKKSRVQDGSEALLTMGGVKAGESGMHAFVNNHGDNCVWVNLSPNVRGRVAFMDLSEDVGQLQDVERHFPVGCALRVSVKNVDAAAGRLDLSARTNTLEQQQLTIQTMSAGMIVPARVTKIGERSVTVQLSDTLAAPVPLVELSDDFDLAAGGPVALGHTKNDIVRVCVLSVDVPNKKIYLSLRPSKVLSSSMHVKDSQVTEYSQLKPGDVVRGFVRHVAEKGVVVALGGKIDAFVRIGDLSDQYVKDWKGLVEVDQLVKGRILSVDPAAKHVLMSLKSSHVDADYTPPLTINDLEVGQVVTGKVRKVEDFGAFVDIDGTQPRLSGLCHRSEVAERRVEDVRKLYSEGDKVKAKVLNVDVKARKISLGLKASYFGDVEDNEESDADEGVEIDDDDGDNQSEEDVDMDGGVDLDDILDVEGSDSSEAEDQMDVDDREAPARPVGGLKTGGFDWTGSAFDTPVNGATSDSEAGDLSTKKRKSTKPTIKEDKTGDLDKYGPQSTSDFERQLLSEPNNSTLWMGYMAFQLQLGEVQKARDIAERALRTMHIRELEEKGRIWTAWLNMEVEYGDEDRVDDVFKRACQVQDPLEMHERLASIYIAAGRRDKADAIFERIVGNKAFRASPEVWLNYATFLMDTKGEATRARTLLPKALKSVPEHEHRLLTAKFAAREFRSENGDPERGRTVFEGLVAEWPKWSSGWDMFVDQEKARVAKSEGVKEDDGDSVERVRALYARMAGLKMKARRAKFVFEGWLKFEEKHGNAKGVEKARKAAEEWANKARMAKA